MCVHITRLFVLFAQGFASASSFLASATGQAPALAGGLYLPFKPCLRGALPGKQHNPQWIGPFVFLVFWKRRPNFDPLQSKEKRSLGGPIFRPAAISPKMFGRGGMGSMMGDMMQQQQMMGRMQQMMGGAFDDPFFQGSPARGILRTY